MSNSRISGLELFQMPFSSHSVSRHQDAGRQQQPAAASTKAPQQSRCQTAVQHPAVHKPNITPPKRNADEIKNAMPAADAKTPVLEKAGKTQTDSTTKQPSAAKPEEPPEAKQKEMVLDMSSGSMASGSDKSGNADDAARRKAHEAAEAKRKAEWDATQKAKKQKEAEALQKLQSMSDDEAVAASTRRISTDVERITRRNMKECVAEHVQGLCRKDPAFARLTMHPHKSMSHCFLYINRKAKEFILQEMKENGIPKDSNGYGSDVPDGMVYQWAEDYFHDADAPEDTEKEEKFVTKPYTGTVQKNKSSASLKNSSKKKEEKLSEPGTYEQMSFV